MIIHAEPLVGAAFEPFGDIIEASRTRNDLVEIEINPLLLRSDGHGAAAADAVVRLRAQ